METSLHQQLKQVYADESNRLEVSVEGFRIDVVSNQRLIEIQHGSLSSVKRKVLQLLNRHDVTVVKPIIARKQLVWVESKGGRVLRRRMSPKRGTLLSIFDELVYFTEVFPHPRLVLDVPLVQVEEWRYLGHGRRRRRRDSDFQVEDRKLISVDAVHSFRKADEFARLLPGDIPSRFTTAELSIALDVARWDAQKIAYCLRNVGAIKQVGKRGNSIVYTAPSRTSLAA